MEPVNKFLYKHKGCYFAKGVSPESIPESIDSLESFEIQDDDIFIITYPKSGTIWTQNIVSLILHEGHRDGTENITLIDRAPWLECNISHIDYPNRPSPRLFTSHLPYYLVPKGLQNKRAKIIYVFRNPKDVLVSTYHFTKITPVRETPKDFDTFLEWFLSGKVPSSLWLDHVEGWHAHKGDFNILFLSYEEMKKDLRTSVLKICNFLGKKLSGKEVDDVVDKATFDNMKVDSRANYTFMPPDIVDCRKGDFLRKGTIGDWKNLMTVAQNERFDRVFKERVEKLPFKFCWDFREDPESISSSVEENNVPVIMEKTKYAELFNYKGYNLAKELMKLDVIEAVEDFETRDSDIFIDTYPKSGTIWTQNIVCLILYEGHRNGTENIPISNRCASVEYNLHNVDITQLPSPRIIMSHLPYYLVPKKLKAKKGKVIYVYRNPKDILVSFFHYRNSFNGIESKCNFEEYMQRFLSGNVASSLVFDHVKGWYTHKNELNILFLCYEEMIQDLRDTVLKICKFIGKELSSQEVDKVVEMSTFKNMKADPRANLVNTYEECFGQTNVKHIRKGTVGDWKNIMTVSQSERFDNILQAQMKDIDLKYIWDIKEIQSTQHGKLQEPLQEDREQKCSTQL